MRRQLSDVPVLIMTNIINTVTDIDECEDPTQCGNPETNHTTCLNTPGSFACPCQRGYTLEEITRQCEGLFTTLKSINGICHSS